MNRNIPQGRNIEYAAMPDYLDPSRSEEVFPSLTAEDLPRLRAAGFARVAAGPAIIDEQMRLMMLVHKASSKNLADQLGPLGETAQFARATDGTLVIETTAQTLSRGLQEELEITQPQTMRLRALRLGSWFLNAWPVGGEHSEQHTLAVCPVLHIDQAQREELEYTFNETEEISAIEFMTVDAIMSYGNVRSGTLAWLDDLVSSGLMNTQDKERVAVTLPAPEQLPGAQDLILERIDT